MSKGRWRALLIEAEEPYRATIRSCLRLANCEVEQFCDPDLALPPLERQRFDLLVWGVSTSVRNRREMISELQSRSQAPLVLIDADSNMAQVDLEAGADQWLPKPFVPGNLVASVHAALRKAHGSISPLALMEIRGMLLDGRERTLAFAGCLASFTRQEWELLSILISHPDRFLSAREILGLGWRAGDHEAEELRTYVHRLRLKLEPMNLPCDLVSQHGQGYALMFG